MSHIQVDGPLHFERAAGVRGVLRYTGGGDPINLGITGADSPPSFAITGSGTLIAEGGTHAGRIENLGIGGTETLPMGDRDASALSVKGTMTIRIERLDAQTGTIAVALCGTMAA